MSVGCKKVHVRYLIPDEFLFSMAIIRTIEHMQMTPVAACDWSVAGKTHARFDLDIDLLA